MTELNDKIAMVAKQKELDDALFALEQMSRVMDIISTRAAMTQISKPINVLSRREARRLATSFYEEIDQICQVSAEAYRFYQRNFKKDGANAEEERKTLEEGS